MKQVDITCDACGHDLTATGNSIDWRLSLTAERKPSRGGFVTDMMIYPAIKHDMHFCGLPCLDLWRDRERHKAKLWKEHYDAWKREHGRDLGNGMWSYPSQPPEDRDAKEAEFSKAALEAFPTPDRPGRRPIEEDSNKGDG